MEGVTSRRACSDHGFVPGPRCPECEDEAYDLDNPEDLHFLTMLVRQRRSSRWLKSGGVAVFLGMALVYGLDFGLGFDGIIAMRMDVQLIVVTLITLIFDLILVYRLPPHMRAFERAVAPNNSLRTLTSMPVFVAAGVIALFVVTVTKHTSFFAQTFYAIDEGWLELAVTPGAIQRGQELGSLVTAGFLHAHTEHLMGNVVGLIVFGMVVDFRVGRLRSLVVLLVTMIAGNLTHAFLTTSLDHPLIGLSGGVLGLAGCYVAVVPERPVFWIGKARKPARAWVVIPIYAVLFECLFALLRPEVAWLAHAGGFAAGLLLGLFLRGSPVPAAYREAEAIREMAPRTG